MKLAYLLAVVLFAKASVAAECLRADAVDHIKMTGPATALATDRRDHRFDVTFVAPCGARHANVFFVMKPESLPTCISAGTALPTNREGVCVVKTVAAQR